MSEEVPIELYKKENGEFVKFVRYEEINKKEDEIERLNNIINKALYWLSENTHYTSLKVDKLIQDDNTNLLELLEILDKGE